MFFGRGLADDLDLQQARDGEAARTVIAQVLANEFGKLIEQVAHLLLGKTRGLTQGSEDFRFGNGFLDLFYRSLLL